MKELIKLLCTPAARGVLESLGVRMTGLQCEEKPSEVLVTLPADKVRVHKITAEVNGRPHVLLVVEERA